MFESPAAFLLIIPVLLLWSLFLFSKRSGIRFASLEVGNFKQGWRARLAFLPQLLLLIALGLLVVCMARPIKNPEEQDLQKEGIAIELVIDTSSSMTERMVDGIYVWSKMDAVKKAANDFVMGSEEVKLNGRSNDLIGLITFARYANTLYPLTFNRNPLPEVIENIDIATRKEDGTHFGVGLQMAIARLEALKEGRDGNIKSKVIIFLTDGLNRINEVDPIEMSKLAKEKGIIIYTIAFATRQQPILELIAETTGGKAFEASSSSTLAEVYKEIDQLEKSKLGDKGEIEGEPDSFKYLLAFIVIYFSYIFLYFTIFRRFP